MAVRLSAIRDGHALPNRNIIFLLLVLIFVKGSKPQGLARPEGLGKLEKEIHLSYRISNQRPSALWPR
jgi:hypothetical protein